MGLFSRNKEPKKITRTFYMITETTKDGTFTTEKLLRPDFPVFEDKEEARVFSILLKHHGIKASPDFGGEYPKELVDTLIQKNWIFIGKKDNDLDYRCWSCKALFSHKQVKWKPRTFNSHTLAMSGGGNYEEKLKLNKEIVELTGMKDEQIASPNRIFNGSEYEYRGNCPKCNVELTCFWFGVDSLKKNPNSITNSLNIDCTDCHNTMRREFQVWYSIRIGVGDEELKEYLITICPKCKVEIVYNEKCDFERGIIE